MAKDKKEKYIKNFNLKEGDEFKSFIDMLKELKISTKPAPSTSVRKAILKELSNYCQYEVIKPRGMKILKVFPVPLTKDKSYSYFKESADVIIYLLASSPFIDTIKIGKPTINICKNEIYKAMNLINNNYNLGRENPEALSEIEEINKIIVDWFFDTTQENNRTILRSGLDYLQSKCFIKWENSYKVLKDGIFRGATDKEITQIIECEGVILEELKLNCKESLYIMPKVVKNSFYNKVNELLKEKYEIDKCYSSIKIYMIEELREIINNTNEVITLLDNSKLEEVKDKLNSISVGKIIKSAKSTKIKHTKELSKLERPKKESIILSSMAFLESVKKLSKEFLDDTTNYIFSEKLDKYLQDKKSQINKDNI